MIEVGIIDPRHNSHNSTTSWRQLRSGHRPRIGRDKVRCGGKEQLDSPHMRPEAPEQPLGSPQALPWTQAQGARREDARSQQLEHQRWRRRSSWCRPGFRQHSRNVGRGAHSFGLGGPALVQPGHLESQRCSDGIHRLVIQDQWHAPQGFCREGILTADRIRWYWPCIFSLNSCQRVTPWPTHVDFKPYI